MQDAGLVCGVLIGLENPGLGDDESVNLGLS